MLLAIHPLGSQVTYGVYGRCCSVQLPWSKGHPLPEYEWRVPLSRSCFTLIMASGAVLI